MTVRVEMICDSVGEHAPRLSTILMYYPHVIHNELLTHRVFSRNSASSRAIPVSKMIQSVLDDPYIPPKWYKNEPGMQGRVELKGWELDRAQRVYNQARWDATSHAESLVAVGAHKQIANRILNPYMHILVLVTSTQWSNFLHVRDHGDAEPSMELLGKAVRACLEASTPTLLRPGEWHLPFTDTDQHPTAANIGDLKELEFSNTLKQSVARCASTSYKTVEGYDMTLERAIVLHDRLVAGDPVHASPTEHQAKVDHFHREAGFPDFKIVANSDPKLSGNFAPGWIQYRKTIPGECR